MVLLGVAVSFFYLAEEGIMPALETSHALAYAEKLAASMSSEQMIIVNLSGRGDKDIHTVAQIDGIEF